MTIPQFGGPWTAEKLEILRRYLDAYTTALKNQPFTLIYVDAFAGAGSYAMASDDYADFHEFHRGSAQIALDIGDRPFDRLVFVERRPESVQALRGLAGSFPGRDISIVEGDANDEIPQFCSEMSRSDRAVVFLDPYATQVSWSTVAAIANTKKIDCWILFPLMAVARMMPTGREPDDPMAGQLNRIFGGREYWRQSYRDSPQMPLFGGEPGREREPGNEQIASSYGERLRDVFHRVAGTQRTLRNSRNGPMFELFFAASNPVGASIAVKIANHILKGW